MLTLHHLNNSRSQRILWLLEFLEVDYQLVTYQRNPETQLAPESLKKIHPLGKSPLITDGGKTLAESAVIIEYLAKNFSTESEIKLIPEDNTVAYWHYQYWMHFAEGSLMPPLLLRLIFEKIKTAPMRFFVKPIARGIANKVLERFVLPNIKNNMDFIENHLKENTFFAGDSISAADFMMSFPLEAAMARGVIDDSKTAIRNYVDKIHAMPSYQSALEKGGNYDYA